MIVSILRLFWIGGRRGGVGVDSNEICDGTRSKERTLVCRGCRCVGDNPNTTSPGKRTSALE